MSDLFTLKNRFEIYIGNPAQVDGKLPEDVLTLPELVTADLAAQGYTNSEIAERRGISYGTVGPTLKRVHRKLGSYKKHQLPVFFPFDPSDPEDKRSLAGKTLGQLPEPRVRDEKDLKILELLTLGHTYERAASLTRMSKGSVTVYISQMGEVWPDSKGATKIIRSVNAIRANYARFFIETLGPDNPKTLRMIGKMSVPTLVEHEPEILEMMSKQPKK